MKRDMQLIRDILLSVENSDGLSVDHPVYSPEMMAYHVYLAVDGNLIGVQDGEYVLLAHGKRLLSAIRDDEIWNFSRRLLADKLGGMNTQVLISVAENYDRLRHSWPEYDSSQSSLPADEFDR